MNTERVKKLIAELTNPAAFDTGEMALEISRRLEPGVSIRITRKGVRVTHSTYCDNLSDAAAVNQALRANELNKAAA